MSILISQFIVSNYIYILLKTKGLYSNSLLRMRKEDTSRQ